jgi:glycerophosphoryl diester phosphodiesterase
MEWISLVIVYIGISWVLFRFPSILHKKLPDLKKKTPGPSTWTIAHRGGSSEKPENTIEAFRNSKDSDMLELDVVSTKDNIIVVTHENHLLRLTGKDLFISDLNYSELPLYKTTFFTHFLENPVSFEKSYNFTTLEQVFKEFKDIYICIDIKLPTLSTIQQVKILIEKYNRHDSTVVYI